MPHGLEHGDIHLLSKVISLNRDAVGNLVDRQPISDLGV